jgi:putative nucleotidyltransferase with HDIG domain
MQESAMGSATYVRLPVWRRLGWRLGVSLILLTAVGILLSGFLQYRAQDRLLRQSLGSLLLNIARTGSLLIDGDMHQAVVEAGRNDTPDYNAIRGQLRRIQQTNQLADAVYTLSHIEGGMARFAVISQWDVPVGEPYRLVPEIEPALHRVLTDGMPAYTDIYRNEHGVWITAFAPVKNEAGKTVAALDVDFRANVYLNELAKIQRRLYLYSLAAAVVALGAGIFLARHITRPLGQLSALARGVVEGDLSTRVHIRARDEIGMLGNVFYLMMDRLRASHRSMTDVLVRALEGRGGETGSLSRVAKAALVVADHLDLTRTQREALELGALLHDIGEIRTPEAVLQKPGPLTIEERHIVQQHPTWGVEILERVPLLTPALDVVAWHHERYDGSGYPSGLKAETIPLAARIFAVVDTMDAMTHDRPYRPGRPFSEALEELRREAGKQFDPRIVEAVFAIPEARWAEILGGMETTQAASASCMTCPS